MSERGIVDVLTHPLIVELIKQAEYVESCAEDGVTEKLRAYRDFLTVATAYN